MTQDTVKSFYDLKPLDAQKKEFDFSQLRNKVVLIVNVASHCGFTPQYTGLQKLYEKYSKNGDFEIIGFPCNQFFNEEPGDADEIAKTCSLKYNVTFPVLNKIEVNGNNEDPVYKFLKSQKSGLLGLRRIKWNFEKFLIGKDGKVHERYGSIVKPESIEKDIERLLKAQSK